MHQLDDLIAQTWFRTSGAEPIRDASAAEAARAPIEKAQKKAVAGLWDLPFSFNISLEQKNIERTTVSAQEITGYFRKEVEPAFAGLDERLRLICELDWLILFYRAVKIISGIPGAAADRGTVGYVRALGLAAKYKELSAQYRALESGLPAQERLSSFDSWLSRMESDLVQPMNTFWRRAEHLRRFLDRVRNLFRIAVLAAVIFVIFSFSTGLGPLASALGIHHPRLTAAEDMEDIGAYPPVPVSDFNASSILGDDGKVVDHEDADPRSTFTDLHLMDGDPTTAWAEGESDNGSDKRIYVNITKKQYVHYIVIYNGNQKDEDTFHAYNRMKRITLRLDAANKSYRIRLKDTPGPQYIRVDAVVDRFWIILGSSYRGSNKKNITCCSEVEVF